MYLVNFKNLKSINIDILNKPRYWDDSTYWIDRVGNSMLILINDHEKWINNIVERKESYLYLLKLDNISNDKMPTERFPKGLNNLKINQNEFRINLYNEPYQSQYSIKFELATLYDLGVFGDTLAPEILKECKDYFLSNL